MAADVNGSPKLYRGINGSSLRSSTMGGGGQFRATELWNDIIAHLRTEVEVKRRRMKMKSYDSCFTGADAVDVVYQRLQSESFNFSKEISRDKAVKLCKLLMENHVFESVGAKGSGDDSKSEFDDSTTKLYRFLEEDFKENKESKDADQFDYIDSSVTPSKSNSGGSSEEDSGVGSSSSCSSSTASLSRQGHIVQELMDITGAWKRHSAECLRKITPAKLFQRRGSVSSTEGDTPRSRRQAVPPAVEQEVRQEVVIGRLLTLVDLPILDGILSFDSNTSTQPAHQQAMAYSNLAFKRHESMSSFFDSKDEDGWIDSANDCLECCPKGSEVLDASFTEDTEEIRKKRIFSAIVEHYSTASPPLWPTRFSDLQVALLNLLMQGRKGTVLQALQLSMMLLPSHVQEEIYRILTFITHASSEDAMKLSSRASNHDRLEEVFTSAVIKNKILNPHQAAQLLWYMVEHREAVFSVPPDVEDTVQSRLKSIIFGSHSTHMELTYCYQVSDAEFKRQQLDETNRHLVDLMNTILDDTKFSLKEKKQRLKQFAKHHPQLHKEFFANIR